MANFVKIFDFFANGSLLVSCNVLLTKVGIAGDRL